jgi:thiol-disulfide isomerase/thioredoxin
MALAARTRFLGQTLGLLLAGSASPLWAANPSAADALQLTPVQRDVEYDRPAAREAAACVIKAEQHDGKTGWVVRNSNGQILRKFIDTNSDNVVDEWCYFSGGFEVYRDIDENFNGKADQYRWLNTAGTRWGLDRNEDGRIDSWKVISAEEVSIELVQAVADRDSNRFARLLITGDELKSLGLGSTQIQTIEGKLRDAPTRFTGFMSQQRAASGAQNVSDSRTKWVHFGGSMPGIIPAGTGGSTKDVTVYENVMAMVQTGEKPGQIPLGTMIQVGSVWRLVDAPTQPGEGQELAGVFFLPTTSKGGDAAAGGDAGSDSKLQELMNGLEKLDAQLQRTSSSSETARLNEKRAELVEQIADASGGEDRGLWIRQLADTISAAAQSGEYPDGLARLKQMRDKLAKDSASDELAAYVEFRVLMTEYGTAVRSAKVDFVTVQKEWLENLKKFVKEHPKSQDTSEALLQLGIAQEFAGQEDEAKSWYSKILTDFPRSSAAVKAEGARNRLNCVGRTIQLSGTTPDGHSVNLVQFRGKAVLVQYWSTNCEPCKADMVQLREVLAKHKRDGFEVIGVNLDSRKSDLIAFLRANKYPWPQIFEEGGLDSPLANSMGILTLPTMLLIDKQGRVVNRSIHISEVEREVGALVR